MNNLCAFILTKCPSSQYISIKGDAIFYMGRIQESMPKYKLDNKVI